MSGGSFHRTGRFLLGSFLCGAFCAALPAWGGEFQIRPSLSVSEEYNDNVSEVADRDHPKSDFVTRVQPGFGMSYKSPFLQGDLGYAFDYRNYARGSRGDESTHNVGAKGQATLVENFLFLELSDTLTRVSLSVARNQTLESPFANQGDQNVATVSPYLMWRIGSHGSLKTGYRFIDTRYWNTVGQQTIDKRENGAFADYNHELTPKSTFTAQYHFNRVSTDVGTYLENDVGVGFRYEYGDKCFLFGTLGNSWLDFSETRARNGNSGGTFSNLFWNAGLTHDFGTVTGTLETKVQYTEDPLTLSTEQTSYTARVERQMAHGSVGGYVSYSEYVAAQTGTLDQSLLTAGGNLRYELLPKLSTSWSLLGDRLFRGRVGDYKNHFNGSAGLSYACNYDITVGLTYTYAVYQGLMGPDSGAGSPRKEINRVLAELKKMF